MTLYDHALTASISPRDSNTVADIGEFDRQLHTFVRSQSGLPLRMSSVSVSAMVDGTRVNGFPKRAMDFILAFAGLFMLMPLLLIVAMLIKVTSPGPVFFRQQREGLNGRLFGVYKFRSMRSDLGDQSGIKQTIGDDPRVTPLGRFLRKTSIDELPQLINVLLGDMSLVGPRPHVPGMLAVGLPYREVVPYYDVRHRVRPGLTGWAQANGLRGPTTDMNSAVARVNHDIAYIQNWSMLLDCRILILTVWRELTGGTGS